MNISLIDILTISIVLILLVLRFIDKKNRSLDKVKRYSDKVREEITSFIKQKAADIKDLSIELQVNLKTGKGILKHIKLIEDSFKNRDVELESMKKILGDYASSSNELINMTARLDENLKRVRQESIFVHKADDRIKNTAKKLAVLEKDVGNTMRNIHEKNRNQLITLEKKFFARHEMHLQAINSGIQDTESKVKEYTGQVDRLEEDQKTMLSRVMARMQKLVKEFELKSTQDVKNLIHQAKKQLTPIEKDFVNKIQKYRENYADLENDYNTRLLKAVKRGEELENGTFAKLMGKIEKSSKILGKKVMAIDEKLNSKVSTFIKQAGEKYDNAMDMVENKLVHKLTALQNDLQATQQNTKDFSMGIDNFEQGVTGKMSTLEARVDAFKDFLIDKLDQVAEQTEINVAQKIEQRVTEYKADIQSKFEKFKQANVDVEALDKNLRELIKAITGKVKNKFTGIEKDISHKFQELKNSYNQIEQKKKDILSNIVKHGAEIEKETMDKLLKKIEKSEIMLNKKVMVIDDKLNSKVSVFIQQAGEKHKNYINQVDSSMKIMDNRFIEKEKAITEKMDNLQNDLQSAQEKSEAFSLELNNFKQESKDQMDELEAQVDTFKEHLIDKLDKTSEQTENEVFQRIDDRLEEYKAVAQAKFNKLEQVNVDIEALDKSLRELMKTIASEIKKEFITHSDTIKKEAGIQKQKTLDELKVIRNWVKDLEKGVTELKQKAYQDVSKKLKVFEDDFFSDLKERNTSMHKALQEWQQGINVKMLNISESNSKEVQKIKGDLQYELQEKFKEMEQKILDDLKKAESNIFDFKNTVDEKMNLAEHLLEEYGISIEHKIEQAKKDSFSLFEDKYQEYMDLIDEQLKQAAAQTDNKLEDLYEIVNNSKKQLEINVMKLEVDFDEAKKEVLESLNITKADAKKLHEEIEVGFKESESGYEQRLLKIESDLDSNIETIKQDFAFQRDQLIAQTQQERDRLKSDLADITLKMVNLEKELNQKSTVLEDGFEEVYNNLQDENKAKLQGLQGEIDNRIEFLRNHVTEFKNKIETTTGKVSDKIEQDFNRITDNLNQIEKQQKAFTAQTKIFERADTLKLSLENDISEIKKEIAKLASLKKEMNDVAIEFRKTKKLVEDTTAKLRKFLAEKRRVDVMESDFKKVISISKSVDLKLDNITSSHDTLQELQAKIRELEELENVVTTRYERLERKNEIIESTTTGVDKNFQQLGNLEKAQDTMNGEIKNISQRLNELKNGIEVLAENKEKADITVEKIDGLDKILKDLEARSEKMETAREWLARTETRLEKITRQAQEQVELFESLLKSEGISNKKEKGAPPLDKRQTVVKLSRQGWSVKEISRATKLSRGEVELILELVPK